MLTRTLVAQESVPAPPKGYLVVRFHTRFESREAIETVSLMRENGEWKIAGITIS
ncbi:DUF4019 domain-containing protein [Aurantiacibacter atlanticus]|uniref:DUF4019 domain-containing protein n=1 Tax=Aurantiacibacter atlanticus TaxID=1648404 RepID=UPI000ACD4E77|nr:DUF4019 domain-containing protein [Aurantiacibacter atlanticus]